MAQTVKSHLLELSDYVSGRIRDRLAGLTDEEYFWEPAPDCWNVRRMPDGTFRADYATPEPDPAPFTTIAWRLTHLIDVYAAERNAVWLGVEPDDPLVLANPPAGTAAEALTRLEAAQRSWRRVLTTTSEDEIWSKLGPIAGVYAEADREDLALHQIDEIIHHSAEISLLRDLYRAMQPQPPLVAALLLGDAASVESIVREDPSSVDRTRAEHPHLAVRAAELWRWDALRLIADLGFDLEPAGPRLPIHHAVASGDIEAARFLIDRGCDLNAEDATWHATPLGWAEYFKNAEMAEFLRGVSAPVSG